MVRALGMLVVELRYLVVNLTSIWFQCNLCHRWEHPRSR